MDRLHLESFLRYGLAMELERARQATTVYYRFRVHDLRSIAESNPKALN
jgi:hypothetical protein